MRRGYTLFELMLVLAIMLVVGALAVPLIFDSIHQETKVEASVDMVRARWADCRTQAIEESRAYCFAVVPNSGRFKIGPLDPFTGTVVDFESAEPNSGYFVDGKLPDGVRFGTKDTPADGGGDESSSNEYVVIAVFLPDGTAQDDVEITFGALNSATASLRLRAMTGTAVSIRHRGEDDK